MYSFTINKLPYKMPETAKELTLGQFIAIRKCTDELSVLQELLGPLNLNSDSPERVQKELAGVINLCDMLAKDIELCLTSGVLLCVPKSVSVLGLSIPIKENFVNSLPYWGYIHTKQAIQQRVLNGTNEDFNATDLIPDIIAHNLYCLVTKSNYNEAKADEFIDVINDMNFIEAMQLGNFFLLQQKRLWTTRQKRWVMYLNLWKSKLVSKFLMRTGRLMYSKPYRVVTS